MNHKRIVNVEIKSNCWRFLVKKLASITSIVILLYLSGCIKNDPPVINSLTTDPAADTLVTVGDTVKIICNAVDPNENEINYYWSSLDAGNLFGSNYQPEISWISPDSSGSYRIACTVWDQDTSIKPSDTLTINVQNYFPMELNNKWEYKAPVGIGFVNMDVTVTSKTYPAEGGIIWHLKRVFYTNPIVTDTLSYYEIRGDSVFFYNEISKTKSLMLYLPLWLNKSWGTGAVDSIKNFGTDAGAFPNSMHVTFEDGMWLAPDVGIAKQLVILGVYIFEFSLTDYEIY